MYKSLILTALLATLAATAPTKRDDGDKYYGVSLYINVHKSAEAPLNEPAPVEINKLTTIYNTSASEISFDKGVHPNVNWDAVECRAYKDEEGIVPGSAPFTANKPAMLSAMGVEQVGSVLCYITEKN